MYHDQPFADRSQRRDTRARHLTGSADRRVQVGDKDFFNPADPADMQEMRTVMSYGRK